MRKFINIINEASGPHQGDRSILKHIVTPEEEAVPEQTANLPATINQVMAADGENHFAPQWFKVIDLPPPFDHAVRVMGPRMFGMFTNTPVNEIEMMADFINDPGDVKHMMEWIAHEGQRLDLVSFLPDTPFQSDVMTYRVRGYDFLLSRDALGHYIFAWPSSDTAIAGPNTAALPAPR